MTSIDDLPVSEYAFPGPLRDRMIAAILGGEKTATTSLVADYELEGEALPSVGDRAAIVDSAGERIAVEEITDVRVACVGDVDLVHAVAEGEGFETVAAWRAGHERFWHGAEYRSAIGDPSFTVDDGTPAVLVRFRVLPA